MPRRDEQGTTPPPANVTPDYGQTVGAAHIVEMLMEVQKTLGHLTATVEHLKKTSDDHSKKVEEHGRYIFAAIVVIGIAVAILGFTVSAAKDAMIALLQAQAPSK